MPKYPVSHDSAESPALLSTPELNRAVWDRAAARMLAKMLGEFAYEEVIQPVTRSAGSGTYTLVLDDGGSLIFTAGRGVYGSWRVAPDSIREATTAETEAHALAAREASAREASAPAAGTPAATGPGASVTPEAHAASDASPASDTPAGVPFRDPLLFLARARRLLGIDGATLGHLVRELTTTLTADARLDHSALTVSELAGLDYAELEGHQTGHPWIVANKGRLGFSATDASLFTPEARRPVRLPWIAVSSRIAAYRGVSSLATAEQLYATELDPAVRESFAATLRARDCTPTTTTGCPCTPGSGTNGSFRCSPRPSPRTTSSPCTPTPICGCRSSPSVPSPTWNGPTGTRSSCRCRSSTRWCGADCRRNAPSPPPP